MRCWNGSAGCALTRRCCRRPRYSVARPTTPPWRGGRPAPDRRRAGLAEALARGLLARGRTRPGGVPPPAGRPAVYEAIPAQSAADCTCAPAGHWSVGRRRRWRGWPATSARPATTPGGAGTPSRPPRRRWPVRRRRATAAICCTRSPPPTRPRPRGTAVTDDWPYHSLHRVGLGRGIWSSGSGRLVDAGSAHRGGRSVSGWVGCCWGAGVRGRAGELERAVPLPADSTRDRPGAGLARLAVRAPAGRHTYRWLRAGGRARRHRRRRTGWGCSDRASALLILGGRAGWPGPADCRLTARTLQGRRYLTVAHEPRRYGMAWGRYDGRAST